MSPSHCKIRLEFDYSDDTNVDFKLPPKAMPLSPTGKNFKHLGWVRAWGKKIQTVNPDYPGGSGFLGDWLWLRRIIETKPHPHSPSDFVVTAIEFKTTIEHLPKATAILAFSISGFQYAFLIHEKTDPVQIGSQTDRATVIDNVPIPYPALSNWVDFGKIKHSTYVDVKNRHLVKMTVNTEVDPSLKIGVGISRSQLPGSPSSNIMTAIHPDKTNFLDKELINKAASNPSAYAGLVQICSSAQKRGKMLTVSSASEVYSHHPRWEKLPQLTAADSDKILAADNVSKKSIFEEPKNFVPEPVFEPPTGLTLPTEPPGYRWALNIRGILLLEKEGEGLPLFPDEVFDIQSYDKKIKELEAKPVRQRETLSRTRKAGKKRAMLLQTWKDEREAVLAMFRHQAEVGVGLTMNARIFGGLNNE